jgi:2-polyprenyl-3-methyl-5-hydroxy-6-metoxy-1,4-benzoquinol methylase
MGTHRWTERTLAAILRPGERVLEIGAGTGELCLRLAARGIVADGLDLCPRPAGWPSHLAWHQADLRSFDGYAAYQAVVANLILHHLTGGELAALGRTLGSGPRVVCACEPARRRINQGFFAILGPILGADPVTRHDARVSIAAGFVRDELPCALGLVGGPWEVRCGRNLAGAYHMIAIRPGLVQTVP